MKFPRKHHRPPRRGTRLAVESLESRHVLAAALDLRLTINGLDAESPPGPTIKYGDPVTWTYHVANTGDLPLTNVAVSDNSGTPSVTGDDFSPAPVLAPSSARGTLEKSFNLGVSRFVIHPTLPYLYAAVPAINSVAIINTETLQEEGFLNLTTGVGGLAISADGSRLYVAGSSIGVVDTQSRAVLPSIPIAGNDVEVGADGRLYVLGNDAIYQINPATGQSAGPNIGPWWLVYSGEMAISPNKDRLYYGNYGLSGASLYQFDLTKNPPTMIWQSPSDHTQGSNGQDLAISSDGSFVSYACGYGQGGYIIAKYRTSDMTILGTFNTGPYPREVTFSPDGTVAYTVHSSGQIDTWDTTTFLSLGSITTAGEAYELIVDRGHGYVFAAFASQLRVYSTGWRVATNVGDGNRNNLLDPGESWSFAATKLAGEGPYASQISATVTDSLGGLAAGTGAGYYVGALTISTSEVPENVSGQFVGTTHTTGLTPSDPRFEVAGTELWLKPNQHLTRDIDNGLIINLHTTGQQPLLMQRFVLTVTSNVAPWQNYLTPLDVTFDDEISAIDVLSIINEINAFGARELTVRPARISLFLDVDGDRWLSPKDALDIVDYINSRPAQAGAAEAESAAALDLVYERLGEFDVDSASASARRSRKNF